MIKILPKNILSIQSRIKRGTKVRVNGPAESTAEPYEAEFDGFTGVDCPYRYCELHPKNPTSIKANKSCDGFMRWILQDEKEKESCPYMGGLDFTIGDQLVVTEILVKKQKPGSDVVIENWVSSDKY